MRTKILKGDYGYRREYKKKSGIIIAAFLLAILIQVIAARTVSNKNTGNILTVMAVLTVLPMANLAAPFLATFKYRTPDREQYMRVKGFENRGRMVYDMVITMREQIMPLDYMLISEDGVDAYLSSSVSREMTQSFLQNNLRENGRKCRVTVYNNLEQFIKRLDKLPESASSVSKEELAQLILSLSV